MRQKLVEADLVDCVIGLGPNLFYNSPMEACIVICRTSKPPERRGKVLFINAVDEVTRERSVSFLNPEHQERITAAYRTYTEDTGFARIATLEDIAAQGYSLSILLYVRRRSMHEAQGKYAIDDLKAAMMDWHKSSLTLQSSIDALLESLDDQRRV